MGSVKFEGGRKEDGMQTCDWNTQEMGNKRIEERDSTLILDQIEAIDDDDVALIDEARQDAEEVAGMLRVTSGCGNDDSGLICILRTYADSLVDFQDISDDSDQFNEDIQSKMDQLVKMLEDTF